MTLRYVRRALRVFELYKSRFLLQEHYCGYCSLSEIYLIHSMFRKLVLLPSSGESNVTYSCWTLFITNKQKRPLFSRDIAALLVGTSAYSN